MKSWFCLRSTDELFTVHMLREANYTAYVPCETIMRQRGRLKGPMKRPVLRGYVFVHCAPEGFTAVRAIGAAEDFLRYTNPMGERVPLRFRPEDLAPIIWAELFGDLDHTRTPAAWQPRRGDTVRVSGTMWKGYLAKIVSVGKKKVTVDLGNCRKEFLAGDLELAA